MAVDHTTYYVVYIETDVLATIYTVNHKKPRHYISDYNFG